MYKVISLNVQLFQRAKHMSWALEKRLTETVPLSTHNICIRHHRDIVIKPNICFGRSKKSLTETVLLSNHNTCKDALFF